MHHNRIGRIPPTLGESRRTFDSSGEGSITDSQPSETMESMIQGLTPDQLKLLAHKVYALLLDELRLDDERAGRPIF